MTASDGRDIFGFHETAIFSLFICTYKMYSPPIPMYIMPLAVSLHRLLDGRHLDLACIAGSTGVKYSRRIRS